MNITADMVKAQLESVIDPELGINIVDLGLIYNIEIGNNKIGIDMTLTSPGCPLAGMLATNVEQTLREAFEGVDVEVSLVWEPQWDLERLSAAAKERLGYN